MKKIPAVLGTLAALAISAAPTFAATIDNATIDLSNQSNQGAVTCAYYERTFETEQGTQTAQDAILIFDASGNQVMASGCSEGSINLIGDVWYFPDFLPSTGVYSVVELWGYGDTSGLNLSSAQADPTYVNTFSLTVQRSQNNQSNTLMGIEVATGTASQFLASANTTISNAGVLEIAAVAVGIPLAFYVLHLLIGLLPKARARRQ